MKHTPSETRNAAAGYAISANRIEKLDPAINISGKRQIINMRNRVIHGYDRIDNEIIWGTIIRHLPLLKVGIDNLMK